VDFVLQVVLLRRYPWNECFRKFVDRLLPEHHTIPTLNKFETFINKKIAEVLKHELEDVLSPRADVSIYWLDAALHAKSGQMGIGLEDAIAVIKKDGQIIFIFFLIPVLYLSTMKQYLSFITLSRFRLR